MRTCGVLCSMATLGLLALGSGCDSAGSSTVLVRGQNHYQGCGPWAEGWAFFVRCSASGYDQSIPFGPTSDCEVAIEFEDVPSETCTIGHSQASIQAKVEGGSYCQVTFERYDEWEGGVVPSAKWRNSGLSCD